MKRKERYIVRLDEVTITREGDCAVIQYKEAGIATTHLKIGPEIAGMSVTGRFKITHLGSNQNHPPWWAVM